MPAFGSGTCWNQIGGRSPGRVEKPIVEPRQPSETASAAACLVAQLRFAPHRGRHMCGVRRHLRPPPGAHLGKLGRGQQTCSNRRALGHRERRGKLRQNRLAAQRQLTIDAQPQLGQQILEQPNRHDTILAAATAEHDSRAIAPLVGGNNVPKCRPPS